MPDRYTPFRLVAKEQGLDALAIVPGANFRRLFGAEFHQNERPLVVLIPVDGTPSAVVPNLELGSFASIGFEGEVYDWLDQDGYQTAFDALLKHSPCKSIGVEGQVMRVFIHDALQKASKGIALLDMQKPISKLRLHKNVEEISAMREAIAISEKALTSTLESVAVGMTESEIESLLLQNLFAHGASELAFSPIVAAGDNSAKPHAHARADYAVQPGDPLLFDFGARHEGVCADITRTVFIQHCSDEHRAIYETVLAANAAGHKATKAGVSAHDVDDAVQLVLEGSKYASRARHKTGHGLGRDIHEDPYIMRGNHQALETGMVFTIEPGLYEIGDMGVRIEDDVIVTDNGCESLTQFDKALTVVG